MWACKGSPSLVPRPVDITTCTKPNRIFFASAKFQPRRSRRQNTNFNYNLYDDDDDDDVQLTTLSTESQETAGNSYFKSQDSGEQNKAPSGCDILRALQRATVRKHSNKRKKQQPRPLPDSKAKLDMISTGDSIGDVDTPIKPLRIKSDWSSRLDDLERRLQDLLNF